MSPLPITRELHCDITLWIRCTVSIIIWHSQEAFQIFRHFQGRCCHSDWARPHCLLAGCWYAVEVMLGSRDNPETAAVQHIRQHQRHVRSTRHCDPRDQSPSSLHRTAQQLQWCYKAPALLLLLCPFNGLFYRTTLCLQCFDAVGWAAGRASGL